ncbi:MAG TPA: hypothetical protein VFC79_13075 [Tissierellaceae bacterium]|nr:hypothetical protein [Tissierellaceae bacterium]
MSKEEYINRYGNVCRDNPIGIMPRWLHIEQRLNKLNEVMQSYIDKNIAVPSEWVEEYIDLRNKYDEIQRKKSISMKGE